MDLTGHCLTEQGRDKNPALFFFGLRVQKTVPKRRQQQRKRGGDKKSLFFLRFLGARLVLLRLYM